MIILSFLATVLSVEGILAINALLSQVPIHVDLAQVHTYIWHYQRGFQAQRNLFLYGLWLALSMAIFILLVWLKTRTQEKYPKDQKSFLLFHSVIAGIMAHAYFEIVAMGNPLWAWPIFWAVFIGGVLISIFWPEIILGLALIEKNDALFKKWEIFFVAAGCIFIFLVIFMPDLEAVVAMTYMGDYFHNWDISLCPAVYAIAHGLRPCLDVYTTYGLGASVMLAKLVNLMGGFDYTKVLNVSMWVGIIYFILWFLLLRHFLASSLMAFAAIVWAMRMHMFNSLTGPLIWVVMTSSVFRFCFDIGVFWMLWMHIQTRRMIFLFLAAFFVSLALFHMLQMGIYIFIVFGVYAAVSAFMPALGGNHDYTRWRNHALAFVSVFIWAGAWLSMTVGMHFLDGAFFKNLLEYSRYFIHGEFEGPLSSTLSGEDPISSLGGFIYPVFCLASLFYCAGQVILKKSKAGDVFAGLLSLYALEGHSYYMLMGTEWYTMGITGLFLLFYWLVKLIEKAPQHWHKWISIFMAVLAVYGLMTTRLFTGYPNLLNFSRNPIVDSRTLFRVGPKQVPYFHQLMVDYPEGIKLPVNSLGQKNEDLKFEKDFSDDNALKIYYAKETSWPEDTALIQRLTPEDGKVPLISSFELLLLQKANRKPFFYYFPLINSRPLTVRNFMVTYLFAYPQLEKVIDQLERQKPEYVFIERIFLTPQVPQVYFYEYDDLISLLRYVFSNYKPVQVGKYLVAMKHK